MRKVYVFASLLIIISQWACDKDDPTIMEFTDSRDGKTYEYVQIGGQHWMTENLAYLPSVSGPEEGSEVFPQHYVFDYMHSDVEEAKLTVNYNEYGVLYNWYAAKTVCPDGWHLPSDSEWNNLEKHLGMRSSDLDKVGTRNSGKVGEKLKSSSGWQSNGSGNNKSGFNALPGGYRSNTGEFFLLGTYTNFWTTTLNGPPIAWLRGLNFNEEGVVRDYEYHSFGFSVRCVKD